MRKIALSGLSLLVLCACGKKQAPEVEVVVEPVVVADASGEIPRPIVAFTGDPTDPVFAGKKLSEWQADLRVKSSDPQRGDGRVWVALKVMQVYGPAAANAVPDIAALWSGNSIYWAEIDLTLKAIGKPVAAYSLVALKSADPQFRARAFDVAWAVMPEAGAVMPDAGAIVPILAELLVGKDENESLRALSLLRRYGPAAKSAVPSIVAYMDAAGPTPATVPPKMVPPKTITQKPIQPVPPPPMGPPKLGPAKKGFSSYQAVNLRKLTAAAALAEIDPEGTADRTLPVLLAVQPLNTGGGDSNLDTATDALAKIGPKAATALMARIKSMDGQPKKDLIQQLWKFKPEHLGAIAEELGKLLPAALKEDVWYLLVPIQYAGPAGKAALPAVLEVARTGAASNRSEALYTALKIGAAPAEVVPILQELLRDPKGLYADYGTLRLVFPQAKELQPFVTAGLSSPIDLVKDSAAHLTLLVDPASPEACRILLEQTQSMDQTVAYNAPSALGRFLPAALPALRTHLDHPNAKVRMHAAEQVARLDPSDTKAVKMLMDNLYTEQAALTPPGIDPAFPPIVMVNGGAIVAFAKAGPGGAAHLLSLCKHPKPGVRNMAAYEFSRMKPADLAPIAPAIAEAIAAADDETCFILLLTLGRIGVAAKPQAAIVRDTAKRKALIVRFAAAQALTAIDPADSAITGMLPELLKPEALATFNVPVLVQPKSLAGYPTSEQFMLSHVTPPDFHLGVSTLWFKFEPEAAIRAGAFSIPPPPQRN